MPLSWMRAGVRENISLPSALPCTDRGDIKVKAHLVGNHWYSDLPAANGSVADGVFVREEKWQPGNAAAVFFPQRPSMLAACDLPLLAWRFCLWCTLINYSVFIVFKKQGRIKMAFSWHLSVLHTQLQDGNDFYVWSFWNIKKNCPQVSYFRDNLCVCVCQLRLLAL